tara:strand:- start:804 stop:1103 length:300 start_codon:yes stop_codon:yes gene_type:complete
MTTFNWTIATLERELSDGGVIVAHWRCTASDGDFSASSYGTAGFTYDAESEDFVAYDDLTEADVLAWVWESVDKDATEAALAQKIDAEKNPTTTAGVPW